MAGLKNAPPSPDQLTTKIRFLFVSKALQRIIAGLMTSRVVALQLGQSLLGRGRIKKFNL
jgi:hypothetical protein